MIRERGAWESGAGAASRPAVRSRGWPSCLFLLWGLKCRGSYGKPESRTQASGTRVVASLPVAGLHYLVPLVFAAKCVLGHASDEAFRRKKNKFPTRSRQDVLG